MLRQIEALTRKLKNEENLAIHRKAKDEQEQHYLKGLQITVETYEIDDQFESVDTQLTSVHDFEKHKALLEEKLHKK